ncbi:MAG: hypothetical protein PVS3B3_00400 [Ktedonobacteraceae bacterium]
MYIELTAWYASFHQNNTAPTAQWRRSMYGSSSLTVKRNRYMTGTCHYYTDYHEDCPQRKE